MGAGLGGLAAYLGQPEHLLVELRGLHRIVSRQRDVFDTGHDALLSLVGVSVLPGARAGAGAWARFSHTRRALSSATPRRGARSYLVRLPLDGAAMRG